MPSTPPAPFELREPPRGFFPPRRRRRDPKPHFLPDTAGQLDPIGGCPALQVPEDDVARKVVEWVRMLDTSKLEAKYSSQGRLGFHPKHVLGVWLLGSLRGIHHASKPSALSRTDPLLRS